MSDATFDNVLCTNGHGDSGQVMENLHGNVYRCPECGLRAIVRADVLEWTK